MQYSVPLGKDTTPILMRDNQPTVGSAVVTDEEAGMVMFTLPTGGMGTITLTTFVSTCATRQHPSRQRSRVIQPPSFPISSTFISSIEEALTVESTMEALLTRGDMGSVTVTITEAFSRVFSLDTMVLLRVSGVPDKAILTVSHAGFDSDATGEGANAADVMGNVSLDDMMIVTNGVIVEAQPAEGMLSLTGDGKNIDIEIAFAVGSENTGPTAAADSLKLTLNLDAGGMDTATEDLEFPIAEGMVRVMATMAPAEPEDAGPYFTRTFYPQAVWWRSLLTRRRAHCCTRM